MVEGFKIQDSDAIRVTPEDLFLTTATMLRFAGLPDIDAKLAADVLVSADTRGVDSHGVSNMLSVYLDRFEDGTQETHPNWRIVRERPSTANIDADKGLGVVIAPKAMQIAIKKARATGLGVVTIFNAGHVGMAAYHAMLALPHDMIGMCLSAANPSVLPTFGKIPRIGTNPIAVAVPAFEEPDFVLDMATSVVPINKIRNAKRMGSLLPPGVIAGSDGRPIMEPIEVPDDYGVLPLGSTRAMGSHKGYGLGVLVDILCSVLAGAEFGTRAARTHYRHYVAAYDIDAFTDSHDFKLQMDELLRDLKSTPPSDGHDRVLVAGQFEWEEEQRRRSYGIPLHREVVAWMRSWCAQRGIDCEF